MPDRAAHPYYQLLERCGQGGMGIVYKALDTRLNRVVALKFIRPRYAGDAKMLQRFHREAEATARLSHPHIAVIYEVGVWDGEPFQALEYVSGGTLKERIHPGRAPCGGDPALRVPTRRRAPQRVRSRDSASGH